MSDASTFEDDRLASHTLAYLRRIDRRQAEFQELVFRQQELISRLDRDMREGFSIVQRDIRELRSDMVLMENRILTRINAEYELSSRISRLEDDMTELVGKASATDDESGTKP
jgi:predicted nuclease with TOPRIM domain